LLQALLSIQPIKNGDALLLDKQLVRKFYIYHGNTDILTLPVEHHGLEFPSIAQINMGLVVEGCIRPQSSYTSLPTSCSHHLSQLDMHNQQLHGTAKWNFS
jgi:hypothetical protein